MSTRRPEDDDDADVDVEVASNEENAELNALRKTAESEAASASGITIPKVESMDVDKTEAPTAANAIQLSDSAMITDEAGPESAPIAQKVKTELDFELESKYSKIWGELKVRFTNRHFLKPATSNVQSLNSSGSTLPAEEISVGGLIFYATDTPVLDLYSGMTPETEPST